MLNNSYQRAKSVTYFILAVVFNLACIIGGRVIEQLSQGKNVNSIRINALTYDVGKMLAVSLILSESLPLDHYFPFSQSSQKISTQIDIGVSDYLVLNNSINRPRIRIEPFTNQRLHMALFVRFLGMYSRIFC